jgi:hypothetical protein
MQIRNCWPCTGLSLAGGGYGIMGPYLLSSGTKGKSGNSEDLRLGGCGQRKLIATIKVRKEGWNVRA